MKGLYTIWQYISVTFWLVLFGLHFVILCSSLPWWVAPQIVSLDWNWTLNKSVRALSHNKVNMKQNVKWKKTNAVVPCSGAGKPCFATLAGVAASSSSSFLISCPNVVSSACICLSQLQGDGPQGVASIPFYELQQDRLDMPSDSTWCPCTEVHGRSAGCAIADILCKTCKCESGGFQSQAWSTLDNTCRL